MTALINAITVRENVQTFVSASSTAAQAANIQSIALAANAAATQANVQQAQNNLADTAVRVTIAQEQAATAQNVLAQLTAAQIAAPNTFDQQLVNNALTMAKNAELRATQLQAEAIEMQTVLDMQNALLQDVAAKAADAQALADAAQMQVINQQSTLNGLNDFVQQAHGQLLVVDTNRQMALDYYNQAQTRARNDVEAAGLALQQNDQAQESASNQMVAAWNQRAAAEALLNVMRSVQQDAVNATTQAAAALASARNAAETHAVQAAILNNALADIELSETQNIELMVSARGEFNSAQDLFNALQAAQQENPDSVDAEQLSQALQNLMSAQVRELTFEQIMVATADAKNNLYQDMNYARRDAEIAATQLMQAEAEIAISQSNLMSVEYDLQAHQDAAIVATAQLDDANAQHMVTIMQSVEIRAVFDAVSAIATITVNDSYAAYQAAIDQTNNAWAFFEGILPAQENAQAIYSNAVVAYNVTQGTAADLANAAVLLQNEATNVQAQAEMARVAADDAASHAAEAEAVLAQLLAVQSANPQAVDQQLIDDAMAMASAAQNVVATTQTELDAQMAQIAEVQMQAMDAQVQSDNAQVEAAAAQAQADAAQVQLQQAQSEVEVAAAQVADAAGELEQAQTAQTEIVSALTAQVAEVQAPAEVIAEVPVAEPVAEPVVEPVVEPVAVPSFLLPVDGATPTFGTAVVPEAVVPDAPGTPAEESAFPAALPEDEPDVEAPAQS